MEMTTVLHSITREVFYNDKMEEIRARHEFEFITYDNKNTEDQYTWEMFVVIDSEGTCLSTAVTNFNPAPPIEVFLHIAGHAEKVTTQTITHFKEDK